jgi:hypothetical protein
MNELLLAGGLGGAWMARLQLPRHPKARICGWFRQRRKLTFIFLAVTAIVSAVHDIARLRRGHGIIQG